MSSEITELRARFLLENQAAYQGLHGYAEVARHEIIRERKQQAYQILQQLEPHIGEEAIDILICEGMELAAQKEQQLKARRREYRRRARLKKQKKDQ